MIKDLDSLVIAITNVDRTIRTKCYPDWARKLSIGRTFGSKAVYKVAIFIKYRQTVIATLGYKNKPIRINNTTGFA